SLLVERPVSGLAAHAAASAMVHGVGALFRARVRNHDYAACGRISRQQNGMTGSQKWRVFQRRMKCRECARGSLAMHPAFAGETAMAIRQQFLARNIV